MVSTPDHFRRAYLLLVTTDSSWPECLLAPNRPSATSGRYRASIRIPIGLNVLTGRTSDLIAVSLAEFPAIVRLRWDSAALERALR